MIKILGMARWLVVASWFVLIGMFSFWQFYPYRVFEVGRVEILTPTVVAGKNVVYRTSACKYIDVPSKVSKILVNDIFIPYSTYTAQTFTGCITKDVSSIIPEFVDEGIYHINIMAEFKVNPIRTIVVNYATPEFRVVK